MEGLVERVIAYCGRSWGYWKGEGEVGHGRNEEKKYLQIDNIFTKVEEMEKVALCSNTERASANKQELCHVKQEFGSLRSYISSLIRKANPDSVDAIWEAGTLSMWIYIPTIVILPFTLLQFFVDASCKSTLTFKILKHCLNFFHVEINFAYEFCAF